MNRIPHTSPEPGAAVEAQAVAYLESLAREWRPDGGVKSPGRPRPEPEGQSNFHVSKMETRFYPSTRLDEISAVRGAGLDLGDGVLTAKVGMSGEVEVVGEVEKIFQHSPKPDNFPDNKKGVAFVYC